MRARFYSRADVRRESNVDNLLIVVDGKVLDVTEWAREHPGGAEILLAHEGEDCTRVFEAFHHRRVKKRLRSFEVGVLKTSENANKTVQNSADSDWRALLDALERRDLFKPRPVDCVVPASRVVACLTLGLAFLSRANALAAIVGGACVGLFSQQSLLLAHDALHGSVFSSRRGNFWTGWFFGTVCGGVGAAWWRRDHFLHHALTNVLGEDPSAGADPFIFIDVKQFQSKARTRWEKALLRLQPWTYAPLCALFARLNLHVISVLGSPSPIIDGLGVVAYLLWSWTLFRGVSCPLAAWLAAHLVCSALHLQLNVGHFATGMWERQTLRDEGWFKYQLLTTCNISVNTAIERWFHGGLEHQIEHHLFPLLPRSQLAEVSLDVQRIALKRGIAYSVKSFTRENWNVWRQLARVSRVA